MESRIGLLQTEFQLAPGSSSRWLPYTARWLPRQARPCIRSRARRRLEALGLKKLAQAYYNSLALVRPYKYNLYRSHDMFEYIFIVSI